MVDEIFTMTIGGKGVVSPTSLKVINPATGTALGQAPECTREQLDQAVNAARKAFPSWKSMPYAHRKDAIMAIAKVLTENLESLRRLLTSEQGKMLDDAASDIMAGAFWCQGTAVLELPVKINEDTPERRSETRHIPLGVVGAIAPWNFPVALAMFKVAPALLAGNTVILKPSPFTPLTTLKIGELLRGIIPDGVLNVISGGDELGPWLTTHPGIDKISFTGSTQTGRKVMASAAGTLKRVTLELGGNDAAIILSDVDVAKTAEQLFWAAFQNSGQICVATKRVYVHEDIYEPFRDALVACAKTVRMGNGAQPGNKLGPVQNKLQYDRVLDLIADAKANSYRFAMGGDISTGSGYFIPLTIIDNPPETSRIVQEEQFGPVLPLLKFKTTDDAIARANATEYGLGASVWSNNIDTAIAIGRQLAAGTVWINESQYLSPLVPFAGHKQSGIGVESGLEGLLEYTASQTITVKRITK